MTELVAQIALGTDSVVRPEYRRYILTAAVLSLNLAMALLPAVVGSLVLLGMVQ